ncbi:MAG TPA: NAD(P)H-dependent glycerol-3-phosphate dehydrogenase [Polyangiaceae bacterium]|nr:NAD(P)H-dependent glycerol-3-phosphate dehydrogenase [Polyangiaceae bacterium]
MTAMTTDLCIVGGGSFGSALAMIAAAQGHRVRMWVRREQQANEINQAHTNGAYLGEARLPDHLQATTDMQLAVQGATVVLMAIPSKSFREVARTVGEHLRGDQLLVHATKGIEAATFARMSQILREETCALKIGVLSGPNLAAELMQGHPSGSVIASPYDEVVHGVQALFSHSHLRVYGGRDVMGVEVGGAFKNIIAIAAGVADGLGFGDNARSLVITRGLSEMAWLGTHLGADVFTFGGLAGIGDLVATCNSKLSRNHRVGERLALGKDLDTILRELKFTAEGVPTTDAVHRRAAAAGLHLPICQAVYSVLFDGKNATGAFGELMRLPVGDELSTLRYR